MQGLELGDNQENNQNNNASILFKVFNYICCCCCMPTKESNQKNRYRYTSIFSNDFKDNKPIVRLSRYSQTEPLLSKYSRLDTPESKTCGWYDEELNKDNNAASWDELDALNKQKFR